MYVLGGLNYMNSNPWYLLNYQGKCRIIAEIGVNHCGDIGLAKKIILSAKDSGADAVKFQSYVADSLATSSTSKVQYQKRNSNNNESHLEMLKALELSQSAQMELYDFCNSVGIEFLSTPYDIESAKFLIKMGCRAIKTASADIVDLDLHSYLASIGLPVMISVGMATLGEIEDCVNIYRSNSAFCNQITLLHCVSNYPCSDQALNLRVINKLSTAFDCPIGYSDHSIGYLAAVLSIPLGVKVIEKHFTIDKGLPGPDHQASTLPDEFKEMVEEIRRSEVILGSAIKCCQDEELEMAKISRKSLTLINGLKKGEVLGPEHLTQKRPGTGIPCSAKNQIIGKKLRRSLEANYQLTYMDIE